MWIAKVTWTIESMIEKAKTQDEKNFMEAYPDNIDKEQFFGPFEKYDEGIKVWSADFSDFFKGKFESIDYITLSKP